MSLIKAQFGELNEPPALWLPLSSFLSSPFNSRPTHFSWPSSTPETMASRQIILFCDKEKVLDMTKRFSQRIGHERDRRFKRKRNFWHFIVLITPRRVKAATFPILDCEEATWEVEKRLNALAISINGDASC
uniref:Uncharacterized protein n=1 Tax=Vespula pensylvanica TaxID=30213 RepID=A0A834PH93_VESPE|nr:hypothetical protein H0235_001542 [Vespula pensylvanica]